MDSKSHSHPIFPKRDVKAKRRILACVFPYHQSLSGNGSVKGDGQVAGDANHDANPNTDGNRPANTQGTHERADGTMCLSKVYDSCLQMPFPRVRAIRISRRRRRMRLCLDRGTFLDQKRSLAPPFHLGACVRRRTASPGTLQAINESKTTGHVGVKVKVTADRRRITLRDPAQRGPSIILVGTSAISQGCTLAGMSRACAASHTWTFRLRDSYGPDRQPCQEQFSPVNTDITALSIGTTSNGAQNYDSVKVEQRRSWGVGCTESVCLSRQRSLTAWLRRLDRC